jgi:hypothetical protein
MPRLLCSIALAVVATLLAPAVADETIARVGVAQRGLGAPGPAYGTGNGDEFAMPRPCWRSRGWRRQPAAALYGMAGLAEPAP